MKVPRLGSWVVGQNRTLIRESKIRDSDLFVTALLKNWPTFQQQEKQENKLNTNSAVVFLKTNNFNHGKQLQELSVS